MCLLQRCKTRLSLIRAPRQEATNFLFYNPFTRPYDCAPRQDAAKLHVPASRCRMTPSLIRAPRQEATSYTCVGIELHARLPDRSGSFHKVLRPAMCACAFAPQFSLKNKSSRHLSLVTVSTQYALYSIMWMLGVTFSPCQ